MFRRKILDDMIEWKKSGLSKKKALVIKGLRQVGKTYIARYFAKEYYGNEIYLDFASHPTLKEVFEGDHDIDRIMLDLSAKLPGTKFVPGDTVIIMDEVQKCPKARASVKSFIMDGRYDVICTGSLMGIKGYDKNIRGDVPVGYECIRHLKSMDFEEFLWAKGIDTEVIGAVRKSFAEEKPVSVAIHQSMMRNYREYLCIGGMPGIVQTYLSTNNMDSVLSEQRDLLEEFKDDFGKHLDHDGNESVDNTLLARIKMVFGSIPSQLSKENKKFQYSTIKKGSRANDFLSAIQWLHDYGLIELCNNLSIIQTPLEGNKVDGAFKVYMQDSGLFVSMLEKGSADDILSGRMNIYKGAVYENIVADAFVKNGRPLYYYNREGRMEIDFVTRMDGRVCLVEVKSTSGNVKSAKTVLEDKDTYGVDQCVKFCDRNVGRDGEVLTLPYYMAFLLDDGRL